MTSNTQAIPSAARPTLKNLTRARVPKVALTGFTLATVCAIAWKKLVSDRHKEQVKAFYR